MDVVSPVMWHRLHPASHFPFPGLWDCWIDRDTGKPLFSFTILTTHSNALMRPIHNRMPVLYDRLMGRAWLEESVGNDVILSLITQPVSSELLEAYEVSTLVNSPDNDSPECVRRVSQAPRPPKSKLPLV